MEHEGIRLTRASAADVERLGKLSDRVFRPKLIPGTGMPREFALAFSAANAHNLYFAEADGEAVSLIALYPSRMVVPGAAVSVVSMGSVCTLPEYRKRHLASRLIERILADYSEDTSLLLVSGGLPIYRRVGCVDFGERVEAEVTPAGLPNTAGPFVCAPLTEPEVEAGTLTRLYDAEPFRYQRSQEEFVTLLRSLRAPLFRTRPVPPQVFVAKDGAGIVAYAVASFGVWKGRSMVELVEWAGSRAACLDLWRYVLDWYGAEALRLYGHMQDGALADRLAEANATVRHVPNQGTVRVLNPALVTQELAPYIRERYNAALTLQPCGEEAWQVVWDGRPELSLPAERQCPQLRGWAELSAWMFGKDGLCLPLPHTDDLNYV